jgi:hypothetical protein
MAGRRASKKRNGQSSRNRKGGKVVGKGTYGCVFSPPLPCNGEARPSDDVVSKLMAVNEAKAEYAEVQKINSVLSSIPNHSQYFSGDGTKLCELGDMTEEDVKGKPCYLDQFNAKEVLREVQAGNIPPPDVMLIQQPNLGMEFFDYVMSQVKKPSELSGLILAMNNLLENGILVMNSKGIYHQDLKSPNLLVAKQVPRIIDWGLALVTPNGKPVTNGYTRGEEMSEDSSVPMRAYMMFNAPISAPFFYKTAFNGERSGEYSVYLSELLNKKVTRQRAIAKFMNINKSDGHFGHLWLNMVKASIDVLKQSNVPGYESLSSSSSELLSRYFEKLIDAYVSNGKFDNDAFYRDFYNNIDLWGWASCYINGLTSAPSSLAAEQKKTFHIACARLIIYLFTEGAVRLDANEMIKIMSDSANAISPTMSQTVTATKTISKPTLGSSQKPRPVSAKLLREPPTPSTSLPQAIRKSAFTKKGTMTKAYEGYVRSLGKPGSRLTSIKSTKTMKSSKTTKPTKPTSVKRLSPIKEERYLSPIKEESPIPKTMKRTKGQTTVKSTYNLRSRKIEGRKTRKGKGGHI